MGIQIKDIVARVKGNSWGTPKVMLLKINNSLAKCPKATTYVHMATVYIGPICKLYAA